MPLLAEYAITPDVLFSSFYSSAELEDALLCQVASGIACHGIVRDLRDGEWSSLLTNPECHLSPRSKEFLKMLQNQRRLISFPAILTEQPVTGDDWCQEALASHRESILSGIITTKDIAEKFKAEPNVASINDLGGGNIEWWKPMNANVEVRRSVQAYLSNLKPILLYANSLLFVDGYLDPTRSNYRNFIKIIEQVAKRSRIPKMVQIHRQEGKDRDDTIISLDDWRKRFNDKFLPIISGTKLKVEVFIWNRLHDRYLLSDLAGISMANGFDEKGMNDPIEITTWSRLDRKITEDRYRMYDEAYRRKDLIGKFTIG